MVSTFFVVQPKSTARRRRKLLKSKPAATSRTTVKATSPVNNALRIDVRDALPPIPREFSCRAERILPPLAEMAGSRPARTPAVNGHAVQVNAIGARQL